MFSSLLQSVSQISIPQHRYVHVLLQFDGFWCENGEFNCQGCYEIDVPFGSTYVEFLSLIRSTVPSYAETSDFRISYMDDSLHVRSFIHDDSTLGLYVSLKLIHGNLRQLPLCVELWSNPESAHYSETLLYDTSPEDGSLSGHVQPRCVDDLEFSENGSLCNDRTLNIVPYSESVLFDTYNEESHPDNNQLVSCDIPISSNTFTTSMPEKVISRFDPTRIAVDAIYESKKDLLYHLKRLAIANYFQFRTRKSNKNVLHVVCVDYQRCNWAVRAVRLAEDVVTFRFRKYNHVHQCPIDARQGNTRQATYDVVAELVKHQFHDATKKPYPPKSIMADMKREHGIYMTYKKAWFAKEKALQLCFGTPQESYASLP